MYHVHNRKYWNEDSFEKGYRCAQAVMLQESVWVKREREHDRKCGVRRGVRPTLRWRVSVKSSRKGRRGEQRVRENDSTATQTNRSHHEDRGSRCIK